MKSIKLPSWASSLLGFDPVPAPPHAFSLRPRELRYGAFRRGPDGFAFDIEKRADLPPETFADGQLGGPLRDAKGFNEALASLLEGLAEPVTQATLVVPDTWMRLIFTELAELPTKAAAQRDVLQWKLKRLVPYRVDDLRISATEVTPFPQQEEPLRLLIGFAIETLLTQLEDAFDAAGIRLGAITNSTLSLMSSLEHAVAPTELAALVAVFDDSYSVSFFRGGEPLIYRYKAITDARAAEASSVGSSSAFADSVQRELRMTATFMREFFSGAPPRRAFLVAPEHLQTQWLGWIHDELHIVGEALASEHLEVTRARAGTVWSQAAPLLGAAAVEVG